MKKTAVLMIVLMLTVLATAAMAGERGLGKGGKLFLFQKCMEPEIQEPEVPDIGDMLEAEEPEEAAYDEFGCPITEGPWPIMFENRRWGQMRYNLVGDTFKFSFQGKRLLPETDYTLIYYPDPWPGTGLICLGEGTSNPAGNLQIHGNALIETGLPAPYDANYYSGGVLEEKPSPSGATGAKIWLALSADVDCGMPAVTDEADEIVEEAIPSQMLGWTPSAYLFEGNLIVYQYVDLGLDEGEDPEEFEEGYSDPAHENNGKSDQARGQGNGNGKAKGKNK